MDGRHVRVDHATFVRRRILAGVGAAVLAIVVVLLLAYAWPGFARSDDSSTAAVTATVTVPPPAPTGSPVALPASATPFLEALPATVGPWVRTGAKPAPSGGAGSPLESWDVTYAGAGSELTVRASQYATASAAQDAFAKATSSAKPSAQGDVLVGGKKAGSYVVVPGSDSQAAVTWSNGTALLTATGPDGVVQQLYGAFGM
jgi:hypothetical protein